MTYTLILSNSRNIVNTDIIDKFLSDMKRLTNNNEVRNWIDKKLKKYMLDEYKIVKPFKGKSKIDDPEWLKKAISDNQATEIKLSKRFINHVTDIVKYLEKLDPYKLSKIFKLSFEIVEKKFMIENDVWDNPEELKEIKRYDRGIRWVNVLGKKALEREGKLLDHCVGGYFSKVRDGESVIYSLRNGENIPECTIEINPNEHCLYQIKGYKDGPIKKEYNEYVVDFLNSYKGVLWREINTRDLMNNTSIVKSAKDGKFSIYDDLKFKKGSKCEYFLTIYNTPIPFTDDFTVKNGLSIENKDKVLPKNLTVYMDLTIKMPNLTMLPKGLTVYGNLNIENTPISTFPTYIKIGGELRFKNTNIKMLPDNYTFNHTVTLEDVEELPNNLTVRGSLIIKNDKITTLPSSLVVTKDLVLSYSNVEYIEPGIKVGGSIYLGDKVKNFPFKIVYGSLYIDYNPIIKLPKGLTIGQSLFVKYNKIILPDNLTIGRIDTNDLGITKLPRNLIVGSLKINEGISELPDDIRVRELSIYQRDKGITTLPKNLKCTAITLYTPLITELPDNLKITDSIKCNFPIKSIGNGIRVNNIRLMSTNQKAFVLPKDFKFSHFYFYSEDIVSEFKELNPGIFKPIYI